MSNKTVTIELPSGALAGWPVLLDALRQAKEKTGYLLIFGDLIAQIERQTTPPKPEEPTGLGAVVEDAAGRKWVRTEWRYPWTVTYDEENGESNNYTNIDVVRVLSKGVTA